MTTLVVPPLDDEPWPTLGPQVAAWMEENLIYGPGDLRGEPYRLNDEQRGLLYRIYEVYPEDHARAGRRRFNRAGISLRKGSAKSEFGAAICGAELHPDGPVRCEGWTTDRGERIPGGRGVTDPYIPLVAYTEEQSEDLAYYTLLVMLSEGPLADDFDIGLERIMRLGGDGKAAALATAPDARDGARTTFQLFDETHRLKSARHRAAHRTMLANIPKRPLADPWSCEITTAPAPGENSIAESTMNYAAAVQKGQMSDSRLFYFHRQASDEHDISTTEGLRAAVIEASGPVAEWSDIDAIVEPDADRAYLERVWLNRLVRAADQAFDVRLWNDLARDFEPPAGSLITLGFDGARYRDATGLIGTHVETGHQWPIGLWERPANLDDWEVPYLEVDSAVDRAFGRWNVWRMYADPYWWESFLAEWAGRYPERVAEWATNRYRKMALSLQGFNNAITSCELSHSGDALVAAHIGAAHRKYQTFVDDEGRPLWTIQKDRPDSAHKIDFAMASVLSWEARVDAIAAGALNEPEGVRFPTLYVPGGDE